MERKADNRGGARPGAGRKPTLDAGLSAHATAALRRKVRRYARKYGKDPDDLLLDVIYSQEEATRDRLAAMKLLKEYTAPKPQEGGAADKALGPAVFLPAHHPVLSVVDGGKGG